MMNRRPMKLSLQHLAEGDAVPAALVEPQAAPAQAAEVNIAQVTKQAAAKAAEAADKKMQSVFRSMLEQQGLDADMVNKLAREWKPKTAGQAVRERDDAIALLQMENQGYQRQITAIAKGIPADRAPKYVRLAESYLEEGADFDEALDAAMADFPADFPAAERMPSFAAKTQGAGGEKGYAQRHADALKDGDTREAVAIKQEAYARGIII